MLSRAPALRGLNARGMKTIRTFSNLSEAGFASSLLEASGIEALLADEQSYTIGYGQVAGGLRLQVEDADVERAERILDRGPDAAGDKPPESEASADAQGRIPLGVFAAGAFAFGVLAFAIFQIKEGRGQTAMLSRDQTYELDSNGDGRPDRFAVYRHDKVIESTSDRNFDGKPDVWEHYDGNGDIQRAEQDQNFDGAADEWFTYKNGIVASSKTDADFNGIADWFATFEHGVIVRSEAIPDESGKAARRQIFKNGDLTEEWVDENRDGVFDYKILHDPFGGMSEHLPMERAKE